MRTVDEGRAGVLDWLLYGFVEGHEPDEAGDDGRYHEQPSKLSLVMGGSIQKPPVGMAGVRLGRGQ